MFGYNYWGGSGVFAGMTFEFIAEKNQFWVWNRRFNNSPVYDNDEWDII